MQQFWSTEWTLQSIKVFSYGEWNHPIFHAFPRKALSQKLAILSNEFFDIHQPLKICCFGFSRSRNV